MMGFSLFGVGLGSGSGFGTGVTCCGAIGAGPVPGCRLGVLGSLLIGLPWTDCRIGARNKEEKMVQNMSQTKKVFNIRI